ncbi:MAG: hypothetical protein ACRCSK_05590 [Fusobacteriaceae bacterium]
MKRGRSFLTAIVLVFFCGLLFTACGTSNTKDSPVIGDSPLPPSGGGGDDGGGGYVDPDKPSRGKVVVSAYGRTVTNYDDIKNDDGGVGMTASGKYDTILRQNFYYGVAQNAGSITVYKNGIGMYTEDGEVINLASGKIYTPDGGTGMSASTSLGFAINYGTINSSGLEVDNGSGCYTQEQNSDGTGEWIYSGPDTAGCSGEEDVLVEVVDNYGNVVKVSIKLKKEVRAIPKTYLAGTGMKASAGGLARNETGGKINITNGIGMYAEGEEMINNASEYISPPNPPPSDSPTGKKSIAINYGTINIESTFAGGLTDESVYVTGIGMKAAGGAVVINRGSIILKGNGLFGMYATGTGSTAINYGTIDMTAATNSFGLYVSSGGIASNYGTISGVSSGNGNTYTNSNAALRSNKNNSGIYIDKKSSLTNSGLMDYRNQTFDTSKLGGGKIYLAANGTIVAKKVAGNIYAKGNDLIGLYKNYGISSGKNGDGAVITDDLAANIISDSIFYNIKFLENKTNSKTYGLTKNYDIEVTKKKFDEVIKNSQYANLLEQNFYEEKNQTKKSEAKNSLYRSIENSASSEEANEKIYEALGNDIYPNVQKQTFESMKFINDSLMKNSLSNITGNFIANYDFTRLTSGKTNYTESYNTNFNLLNIGYVKENFLFDRVGIIGAVGQSRSDFGDTSSLTNMNYEVALFAQNNIEEFEYTGIPYFGYIEGDLNRKLNYADKTAKANITSNYFGFFNQWLKRNEFEYLYLNWKVQLDAAMMIQKSVQEDLAEGISLDETTSNSVAGSFGADIGKNFRFGNDFFVDLSFNAMYTHEFANPNNALSGSANSIYGKVSLDKFSFKSDYGFIGGRAEFGKGALKIYSEYKFLIGQEYDEQRMTSGINYKF